MAAFCRVTPSMSINDVAWQVNCVAFALPGIGLNASTLLLLRKFIKERGFTKEQALAALCSTVSALLSAPPSDVDHLTMVRSLMARKQAIAA